MAVRGAEAEDEAFTTFITESQERSNKMELQSALGKLMKTLSRLENKDKNHAKIPEVGHYMIQIYRKLGDETTAREKSLLLLLLNQSGLKLTPQNKFLLLDS